MWAWTPAFLSASLMLQGQDLARATGGGARLSALFHLTGFLASSTAGHLSDRFGRTAVIIAMLAVSTVCSMTFGWLVAAPFWLLLLVGLVYGFSAVGDSPVLSVALTEAVAPQVLGSALAVRSLLGFGAGAVAQWAFGKVLDATNPGPALHRVGMGLRPPRGRRSGGPRLHDLAPAPAREPPPRAASADPRPRPAPPAPAAGRDAGR